MDYLSYIFEKRFISFINILSVFTLFCFLFFSSYSLNAQNFSFRQYSVLDGLPQSQVNSITQDSRGFFWITTRNGLSRFDGVEFVNYYRKDGLLSNNVNNVFEDNDKNVWIISPLGLSKYTGNGFVSYPLTNEYSGWLLNFKSAIYKNNCFVITASLPRDTITKLILFSNGVYSDFSKSVPALDTLETQNIIFNKADDQLMFLDSKKRIWIIDDSTIAHLPSRKFDLLYTYQDLVLAKADGLVYKYSKGEFAYYNYSSDSSRAFVNDKSLSLNDSLVFFDGKSLITFMPPFSYTGTFVDREGILWFASEGNLYKLLSTAFTVFTQELTGMRNIWAMVEDKKGHIWFGSLYNRLFEFNGNTFTERNEFRLLFNRNICFYKGSRRMSNGDVWFSTDNGVLIWNGSSFTRLKGIPENTQICYIYEDRANSLTLLGTEKGLFAIKKGKITLFPEFNDSELGVIEGITLDESGRYLLSGHRGVLYFDLVKPVPVKEKELPNQYTYTVAKDFSGGLWVSSEEGLFHKGSNSVNFVPGLPHANNRPTNSVLMMDNTHLLAGRVSDIVVLDIEKYNKNGKDYYKVYDKSDGFSGSDCIDNGIVKDLNGNFWILTSDKVVRFKPENLKENLNAPIINLTGFEYQTDSLDWIPVDSTQNFYGIPDMIRLNRLQNNLRIRFTGISTTNPEKVLYRYRLEGYDKKWSLPTGIRSALYEKLSHGVYNFQVKSINSDGVENEVPLELKFRIMPAIWQTTVARILFVIIFLSLATTLPYMMLRRRHRKQIEEDNMKAELARLQMSSVLRQFDPHFTFNVISSVGSLIMKGEKETAYDYITKLSGLLRTVLSDGSLIIRPLSDEVEFVRKYCELQHLRFKDRFRFEIEVADDVDMNREIPKMTIQTFVENAIKHGFENRKSGGLVSIGIRNSSGNLLITIRDNGIGRKEAAKQKTTGSGSGVRIVKNLFELMNRDNITNSTIEINDLLVSGNVSGTEVLITIPAVFSFVSKSDARK